MRGPYANVQKTLPGYAGACSGDVQNVARGAGACSRGVAGTYISDVHLHLHVHFVPATGGRDCSGDVQKVVPRPAGTVHDCTRDVTSAICTSRP